MRGRGVLSLIFVSVILLLVFYVLTRDDSNHSDESKHLLILIGVPMIALAIACLLTTVNENFAEWLGASLGFSLLLSIGVVNMTSLLELEVTTFMRTTQIFVLFQGYLLSIGLFNVSFVQHVIVRVFWYLTTMSIIFTKGVEHNDYNPSVVVIILICSTVTMETIFYILHKAEAKLFLFSKVTLLHES